MTIGTENWTENPAGSPDFKEDRPEETEPEKSDQEEEEPFTRDDFLGDLKRAARKLAQRKPSESGD